MGKCRFVIDARGLTLWSLPWLIVYIKPPIICYLISQLHIPLYISTLPYEFSSEYESGPQRLRYATPLNLCQVNQKVEFSEAGKKQIQSTKGPNFGSHSPQALGNYDGVWTIKAIAGGVRPCLLVENFYRIKPAISVCCLAEGWGDNVSVHKATGWRFKAVSTVFLTRPDLQVSGSNQ